MFKTNKGQSTLEYAVIIAVVVAALLAMRTYMTRGIQGKLRSSADSIGEQYVPGKTVGNYTTQQEGTLVTKEQFGGGLLGTNADQGISRYEVTTAATKNVRSSKGDDKEQITVGLSGDTLF